MYDAVYQYLVSGYAINHRKFHESPSEELYDAKKMAMMSDLRRIAYSVLNAAGLLIPEFGDRAAFLGKTMTVFSRIYPNFDDGADMTSREEKINLLRSVLDTGYQIDMTAVEALLRTPKSRAYALVMAVNRDIQKIRIEDRITFKAFK